MVEQNYFWRGQHFWETLKWTNFLLGRALPPSLPLVAGLPLKNIKED